MAMVDTLRTFVFSLQTLPKYLFHTLDKEKLRISSLTCGQRENAFRKKMKNSFVGEKKIIGCPEQV